MIGSSVGPVVDGWIAASLAPGHRFEGLRLDCLRGDSWTECAVISRLHDSMRIGSNII